VHYLLILGRGLSGAGVRREMAKIQVLGEPFWVRRMENVKMFSLFSLFLFGCSGGLSRPLSVPVFSVLGLFILEMEAICSSKMLVAFYQTAQCYSPEECTLCSHQCENLKS
jgi:hypothetical protein